jgi:hypothetical protein
MSPANAIELDTLQYITLRDICTHLTRCCWCWCCGGTDKHSLMIRQSISVPHTFVTHPSMFQ